MKFKVGDKVVMKDLTLNLSGLTRLKIKHGIITKIDDGFIWVRRGKENALWHPGFWRKEK